jgi:hypothetical protein
MDAGLNAMDAGLDAMDAGLDAMDAGLDWHAWCVVDGERWIPAILAYFLRLESIRQVNKWIQIFFIANKGFLVKD